VDLDARCPPLALPGGSPVPCTAACTGDAQCDDGDPCTSDVCTGNLCTHTSLAGLDAARCVCQRPPVSACAGQILPKVVAKPAGRACRLITTAAANSSSKKARRLARRSAKQWKVAKRAVGRKPLPKKLGADCAAALQVLYTDAATRSGSAVP
jgi:hypothetical protein